MSLQDLQVIAMTYNTYRDVRGTWGGICSCKTVSTTSEPNLNGEYFGNMPTSYSEAMIFGMPYFYLFLSQPRKIRIPRYILVRVMMRVIPPKMAWSSKATREGPLPQTQHGGWQVHCSAVPRFHPLDRDTWECWVALEGVSHTLLSA